MLVQDIESQTMETEHKKARTKAKSSSKNIQKQEAGKYTVSVAPFWNLFAPPAHLCP